MRLFCIMAAVVEVAESCRDRPVTGRSALWNETPALLFNKTFLSSRPGARQYVRREPAQLHKRLRRTGHQWETRKHNMNTRPGFLLENETRCSGKRREKKSVKIRMSQCLHPVSRAASHQAARRKTRQWGRMCSRYFKVMLTPHGICKSLEKENILE